MQANLGGDATLFSSAGGFANYFSTPDYQKAAVSEYFAAHDPGHPFYISDGTNSSIGAHGGIYNRAGRVSKSLIFLLRRLLIRYAGYPGCLCEWSRISCLGRWC